MPTPLVSQVSALAAGRILAVDATEFKDLLRENEMFRVDQPVRWFLEVSEYSPFDRTRIHGWSIV
jgi:hypothetical protein